jgi:peroxiredoxin family protein
MPMKMPVGPEGFRGISWSVPHVISANVPGFDNFATSMMKKTFEQKGVATIEELREACVELDVKMIACQMTMDVFGFDRNEFIDGIELGGAATFLEFAAESDINLFV